MPQKKRPPVNPEPGKRVKLLLEKEKMTHERLGELIGMSPQHISRIVNGHATLYEDVARRIIDVFPEYELSWLLGFSDYPTQEIRREEIQRQREDAKDYVLLDLAEQGMIRLAQASEWKVYKNLTFVHDKHQSFKLSIWEFDALREECRSYVAMRLKQLSDMYSLYDIDVRPREAEE